MAELKLITNHGLVLLAIAKSRGLTAREIGDEVGITERYANKIILDLEKEGYILKTKVGNKNMYQICPEVPINAGDIAVGDLLQLLGWNRRSKKAAAVAPGA